jgi:predicted ATPase
MLLKEITLSNFLSFGKEQTVHLHNLNILIGANGSGKSNLLEAVDLLHNAPGELTKPVREGGGVTDWIWKGAERGARASLNTVLVPNKTGIEGLRYTVSFSAVNQRFEIRDERIENSFPVDDLHDTPYFYYHFNGGRPYLNVKGKKENAVKRYLQTEEMDLEKSILSQRKDPDQYPEITYAGLQLSQIRLYREWSMGRYTLPRLPQKADLPNKYLEFDYSNLGLVLNKLRRDVYAKGRILQALSDLNEGISDFDVQIEGGTVQVFLTVNGFMIPATRLSDGTLRYLCLLAILCNPDQPPLVCIEEPELGLHPDLIHTVAQILKEASEHTQLIVTTHSASLVDSFTDSPECVFVAENRDGNSTLQNLDKERLTPWLKEYRLGQLWMSGEIGGTRW